MKQPIGYYCQSCAMPMGQPDVFGTNTDGSKNEDYCTHCYQNGAFMMPDITMEEMLDKCVSIMAGQNIMPENQARELLTNILPTLKRWQA